MPRLPDLLLAIVTVAMSATPCWSECQFTAQTSAPPIATGRVAYLGVGDGLLYMFDLKTSTKPIPIIQAGWGITANAMCPAENPKFSANGKALLFAAASICTTASHRYDLFYLMVPASGSFSGAAAPVNLTKSTAYDHNEDPQFSHDGTKIVWKRNYNIAMGTLNVSGAQPSLTGPIAVTQNRTNANNTEASEPTFSFLDDEIYFQVGSSYYPPIHLAKYDIQTKAIVALGFTQDTNDNYYYYPVTPNQYGFIYVSSDVTYPQDKIFLFSGIENKSNIWNPLDCAADNSDPAPVNEDYFIYARNPGSQYSLYLGQLSTARAWSLAALTPTGAGGVYGSNYTRFGAP